MTKAKQTTKNIKLSEKLASFIEENPSAVKDLPNDASFVFFSSKDKELNKVNSKLVDSLVGSGSKVVKAEETNNKKQPWRFIPVSV